MQLYNTLKRQKEEFIPVQPGKVGMYVCGITAYDYCHIGHARSAVAFDVLVRYLRSQGLDVTFVRNFTDVDDKIINRANQEGLPSGEISEKYIRAFHEDMDRLNVLRADIEPKATEHIQEMLDLNARLIENGHAYATPSGDVYFRVESFKDYGKLSGRSLEDMQAGARVAPGEEKEHPMDFALWKAAKPGEPAWDSPWGKGRPGWHIECSAMSEKYLPLPLDIHGGGQDLIFPHHENEIAQTEASHEPKAGQSCGCGDTKNVEFCRYWVHNGFVQINSEKMSKSLGNFKTIRDILEFYLPEVLRFFLLTRQYRSPIDFSTEAIEDAEKNLQRIYQCLEAAHNHLSRDKWNNAAPDAALLAEISKISAAWDESMADDLNSAAALGHVNTLVHLINRVLEDKNLGKSSAGREVLELALERFKSWNAVLGLFGQSPAVFRSELRAIKAKRNNIDLAAIEKLVAARQEARKNKDFVQADAVRDQLADLGVELRDTVDGVVWDLI
ncbi:MAG: cysteine--tRNA ligase [Deltaproteobacteria bacterium]|jgi:cysteinyl-tRNA synthetase|nr:cysteine--tRNA ligase [Deltaproteobacteria bacterium]